MSIFYDTCAMLNFQAEIFNSDEKFYLSNITLQELENIKNSEFKSEDIKYKARKLLQLLNTNKDKYEIIIFKRKYKKIIKKFNLPETNDSQIIACAYSKFKKIFKSISKEDIFATADQACEALAYSVGLNVLYKTEEDKDNYTGFIEICLNDIDLAKLYGDIIPQKVNKWNLYDNQYIIIRDKNNNIVDKYKWHNNEYIQIQYQKIESKMFGKLVPKDGDIYQQLALDSLKENQITMLRGAAGSGKSYLSFGYMFSLLEKGKIDKIIVFCNTVATKGSAKLGFYPGSRTEKLLDSQIGNLLESKLGDRGAVEKLIDDGQLVLLPMSDIRGYDTTGMNAAIYLSEAQNLDIELMRLALQRIGEDSICIIDGDFSHQVDMSCYAGAANGMRRASKIFRGQSFYGEIELQKIHRSKIAEIAELM